MEIYIGQPSVLFMQGGCVSNLEEAYAYSEDPYKCFLSEDWLES